MPKKNTYDADITVAVTQNSKEKLPKKRIRQKPFEWFDGPYNPVRGESALWVAVITQALMDALSRATTSEARYHKHEATRWLTGNSRDFITVCLFAGFDPDYIRRKAKKTLANPLSWRAEPGKGKRYLERKEYRKKLKEKAPEESTPSCRVITGPWVIA